MADEKVCNIIGTVPMRREAAKYFFLHEQIATAKSDDGSEARLALDVLGGNIFVTFGGHMEDGKQVFYMIGPKDILDAAFAAFDKEKRI